MYQYSLEFFILLFKKRLEESENPTNLEERLQVLLEDITRSFYVNICRGLFERDKLLFSFLIAIKCKMSEGVIRPREWNFFLRGGFYNLKKNKKILNNK